MTGRTSRRRPRPGRVTPGTTPAGALHAGPVTEGGAPSKRRRVCWFCDAVAVYAVLRDRPSGVALDLVGAPKRRWPRSEARFTCAEHVGRDPWAG